VNLANTQTLAEFAKMTPYQQLSADVASGNVANFSYIVPDECHDMHGPLGWTISAATRPRRAAETRSTVSPTCP
jgi:hypothetical protein